MGGTLHVLSVLFFLFFAVNKLFSLLSTQCGGGGLLLVWL
jgi:hypothetical protein